MKFSDKLGLRQQWKKELFESELKAAGELEGKATAWRTGNYLRRWRDRYRLVTYYKFKATVISKKHGFGVVMDHVKAWRDLILGDKRTGPGFGNSVGARIQAADRDSARRKWGKPDGGGEWEHGGALTIDDKRGQFGKASTPSGLISRSTAVTPNPGNFAMRSPVRNKNTDPQSKQHHAPLSSPRNQRTNLKGPKHHFTRMADSKFGDTLSGTTSASDFLATKKSTSKGGVS